MTNQCRDKHDRIIVEEKLDGRCVAVAKLDGEIVPLIRAGYSAAGSNYSQHHVFAEWVKDNRSRFDRLLNEGERCVGEWLMEAHGTIYNLPHEPFVIFDIISGHARTLSESVKSRCAAQSFVTPRVLHIGGAISVARIIPMLEPSGHGAVDGVEGAVWRVERNGAVDFLGKYVRPDKDDGKYLETISGKDPIYNWLPNRKA